jgi:hypothetical protein
LLQSRYVGRFRRREGGGGKGTEESMGNQTKKRTKSRKSRRNAVGKLFGSRMKNAL